ncbi:response regulator [Paenibacillus caseinilyticus]|nr:response regulator [Paenibacillus mucilaginosus]
MKLCVIDDIKSVVEVISRKIDWAAHGIDMAGTALDGEEGLRLVQEVKPDVILTDIRMPKLDGLQLTRRILEDLPNCRIIILSAYTDFSHAQQAIRLGAFDFVKKPFAIDEILNAVLKAKAACEEERQETAKLREMELKIKMSLPVLRQEYLTLLVHHQTNEITAIPRWDYLGIGLVPNDLVVFVVEIDRFMDQFHALPVHEIELIRFSLQNIIEETVASRTKGIIFREATHRYAGVMNSPDNPTAADIAEACCLNIARYTRFTVSIGVGLVVKSIPELPYSYRQAVTALSYHFYTEGNGVYSYMNAAHKRKGVADYSLGKEQEFLFALRSGNAEKSRLLLEDILNDLTAVEPWPEPKYVEHVGYELSAKMFRVLLEKFPYDALRPFEEKLDEIKSKGRQSLQELRSLLTGLCEESCRRIEKERSHESTKLIQQAGVYIRGHLHLDLTLEHCARQFNLSPGYFSNLFKKIMGISFQQFVIQEKMEQAKSMLIDNYQIQEIAQKLGYEHRRYFSELFKKQTGMTPSEFKESCLGKP